MGVSPVDTSPRSHPQHLPQLHPKSTHIHCLLGPESVTPHTLALANEDCSTGSSLEHASYLFWHTRSHVVSTTELDTHSLLSPRIAPWQSVCQLVWLGLLRFYRAVVGASKGVGVAAMSQGLHKRANISSLSI